MPVPTYVTDLDTNANNNSPPGTESAKGNIDNYLRAGFAFDRQIYNLVAGATSTIASAASVAIGAAAVNNIIISGTTAITSFDSYAEGAIRLVVFSGALTLTHNATTLQLPGSANITTAAGDFAIFKSLGSGNWKCLSYQRAAGLPAKAGANSDITSLSGLTTALSIAQGGTGATSAAAALSSLGAQAALGFTPIQQGGGAGQNTNKIYLGWDGAGSLKGQVDTTDMGRIWSEIYAAITLGSNGKMTFLNGLRLIWGQASATTGTAGTLTFHTAYATNCLFADVRTGSGAGYAQILRPSQTLSTTGLGYNWDQFSTTGTGTAVTLFYWALGY